MYIAYAKLFLLLPVLLTARFAVAAEPCEDSATPQEIVELLKQPEAKLTLTPASFIRLQPEIRKAFGQRLTVCPQIPLNAKGKPYTKLRLDFPDIWDAFEIAVNNGDWEQAQFIADSVQANPLPPEAFVSLLTVPLWDQGNMAKAAQILGAAAHVDGWRFFLLDAFQTLGGKTTATGDVVWSDNPAALEEARTRAEALEKSAIFTPYSGKYQKEAVFSLGRLGLTFINARNYSR